MLNKFFETTDDFNFETEKQNFVSNLDMLKTLSVQESTLYKKKLDVEDEKQVEPFPQGESFIDAEDHLGADFVEEDL